MTQLTKTCADILAGYASGKSGVDMYPLLSDLAHNAENILELIERNAYLTRRVDALAQLVQELNAELDEIDRC